MKTMEQFQIQTSVMLCKFEYKNLIHLLPMKKKEENEQYRTHEISGTLQKCTPDTPFKCISKSRFPRIEEEENEAINESHEIHAKDDNDTAFKKIIHGHVK